jgi:hypothetical protein
VGVARVLLKRASCCYSFPCHAQPGPSPQRPCLSAALPPFLCRGLAPFMLQQRCTLAHTFPAHPCRSCSSPLLVYCHPTCQAPQPTPQPAAHRSRRSKDWITRVGRRERLLCYDWSQLQCLGAGGPALPASATKSVIMHARMGPAPSREQSGDAKNRQNRAFCKWPPSQGPL